MMLIDLTHTSHTAANTGIQRQARGVYRALEQLTPVAPICLDPFAKAWRPLGAAELQNARGQLPVGSSRGAQWTLAQKLCGWSGRLTGRTPPLPPATGLICPEIFSPKVAARLPELLSRCAGPRIAFYFDSIPLTHPEFTPPQDSRPFSKLPPGTAAVRRHRRQLPNHCSLPLRLLAMARGVRSTRDHSAALGCRSAHSHISGNAAPLPASNPLVFHHIRSPV